MGNPSGRSPSYNFQSFKMFWGGDFCSPGTAIIYLSTRGGGGWLQRERAWGGRGNKKTLTEINNHLWWLFRKSSCLYLLLHLLYEWNLSENQYMVTTRGNYENVKKAKNEISELNNYFQGVLSWFSSDKIWVLAPTLSSES